MCIRDRKLKLQVSVRSEKDDLIAFADEKVIIIARDDIPDNDKSEKDSATGLLQRNGEWEFG